MHNRHPHLDLGCEAIAARELREALLASHDFEPSDVPLALASETNIYEALERVTDRLAELEMLQAALKGVMNEQAQRLARFKAAHERLRDRIKAAFETASLPSPLELPTVTISIGKGRPKVNVLSLLAIPKQFLRFKEPEPNKEAIQLEWRDGRTVPGVEKGNAEPILIIKRS